MGGSVQWTVSGPLWKLTHENMWIHFVKVKSSGLLRRILELHLLLSDGGQRRWPGGSTFERAEDLLLLPCSTCPAMQKLLPTAYELLPKTVSYSLS